MMKDFKTLQHENRVKNKNDNTILTVVIWREEMYLAGEKDMWPVKEFDPVDWEIIK